ncbi:MAG: hypothetical protein CUN55_15610, partial [Phototrophicales bacterium]
SALLLGTGTMLMPYSKTFYREPLMMLFVMVAFVMALKIRAVRNRMPLVEIIVLIVAMGFAIAAKGIAVLFLPAIGLLMFRAKRRDWLLVGILGGVTFVLLALLEQFGGGGTRFSISRLVNLVENREWRWISESFRGYVYSPRRSFFLYSPIFVLAPFGMWHLWKRGHWRLVLSILGLFIGFAAGYGFLRTDYWEGGPYVGPRYLLPLVPIFGFTIPPIISTIRQATHFRMLRYMFISMIAFSVGVAVLSTSYSAFGYPYSYESPWNLSKSPLVYYLQHINFQRFDTVWRYSDWWWLLLGGFAGVACVAHLASFSFFKRWEHKIPLYLVGGVLVLITLGLFTANDDPLYLTEGEYSKPLLNKLAELASAEDAVMVSDMDFLPLFAAHYKASDFVVSLPLPPG